MTAKEQLIIAAIKPFLPQIRQQLTPALQMFLESRLKEIDKQKSIANTKPIILICPDTQGNIYLCDALMKGVEIVGITSKVSLDVLTNQIIANLTELWTTTQQPKFFTFATDYILFRTEDSIDTRKPYIRSFDKVKKMQETVNKRAKHDPHYHRRLKQ